MRCIGGRSSLACPACVVSVSPGPLSLAVVALLAPGVRGERGSRRLAGPGHDLRGDRQCATTVRRSRSGARAMPSPPGGTTRTAAASRSRASARAERGRPRSPSPPRSARHRSSRPSTAAATSRVAYTSGGATTIATWAAGGRADAGTAPGCPALAIGGFAVNAAGDAVLAGRAGSPGGTHGRLPEGPDRRVRAAHVSLLGPGGIMRPAARAAINASGSAVVIFRADDTLRVDHAHGTRRTGRRAQRPSRRHHRHGRSMPSGSTTPATSCAAFTYISPVTTVLRAGRIPAVGGWQESGDLGSTAVGSSPRPRSRCR